MPAYTTTTAETVAKALQDRLTDDSAAYRAIQRETGLAPTTAHDLVKRYGPVAEAFRTTQTAFLLGMWQSTLIGVLAKLHDAAMGHSELSPKDAKDWAIIGGIATEKVLLLDGKPTSIVTNLHDVRVDITGLASRLADVSRRIALPRSTSGSGEGQVIEAE